MIGGIGNLYHLRQTQPEAALRQSCREFEAVFAQQLLKTMGESVTCGLGEGIAGGMYQDMLYSAVAQSVSKGEGLGIAEVLYQQMSTRLGMETNGDD